MADYVFETQLSNRDFFIRRWQLEYPAFVDVCNALPADRLDYRPHPGSRSAGEMVALLVSLERGCVELCSSARASYNSRLSFHPTSDSFTLKEMVAAYEKYHGALAEKLDNLDEDTWNRAGWLTRGEQEIILMDSIGGLLWTALFDAIHH